MRTRPTDDERAVKELFDDFFGRESPAAVVRSAEPLGFDADLWAALRATGAPGMGIAPQSGGGGASLCEVAMAIESWGAHLAPVPLVEHTVATRLLAAAGEHTLLPAAAGGERIATLALRDPVGGRARLVPAGAVADTVLARRDDTVVVARHDPPLAAAPNTGCLPLADRDLGRATPLPEAGPGVWERALDEWRALMAVAYVGLARRAIELAVDYVIHRHQFGVPVGSFQAVQHGLADAATSTEGAHLLAHRAVWALEKDRPDAARLAGMALLFAAETARFATDRALQYHGGYGFAEEYDIQLHHRRASAWLLQLGEPAGEYARLADLELGPRRVA